MRQSTSVIDNDPLPSETDSNINKRATLDLSSIQEFRSQAEMIRSFYYDNSSRSKSVLQPSIESNQKVLSPTKPKTPHFHTADKALKRGKENRPVKFVSQAELINKMFNRSPQRFHSRPKSEDTPDLMHYAVGKKPTKTQPFNLQTDKRITDVNKKTKNEYKTTAELIDEFNGKFPGKANIRNEESPKYKKMKIVVPKTPNLKTSKLVKHDNIKSTEEIEYEKFQKTPKFKALPLNHKIFESNGDLGVPKVEKKPLTIFKEFKLKTKEMSKKRSRSTQLQAEEEDENKYKFKARKMPKYRAMTPAASEKPLTTPEPFHLKTDIIHEKTVQILNEKLEKEKEEEEEMRNFKAHPVCSYSQMNFAKMSEKPLTQFEPFHLQSEVLHKRALEEFQQRIEEQKRNIKKFKARDIPGDVIESKPIELRKGDIIKIRNKEIERAEGREEEEEYNDGRPPWQN